LSLDIRSRQMVAVIAVALAIGAAVFWAGPRKAAKHTVLPAPNEAEARPDAPPVMLPAATEVTGHYDPSAEPVAPAPTPEPATTATGQPKELTCPALEPAAGAACSTSTDAGLRCVYQRRSEEVLCICEPSVASNWDCKTVEEDPPVVPCPAAQPASDSNCGAPDQLCVYGVGEAAQACQCKRDTRLWSCIGYQTWRGEK
jgi:hypothetical protein